MAKLTKPKDIFIEFLRTVYKEPARNGLSKRHTNTSGETHNPSNGDTEITVSNTKLLCVNSVDVDGTTKYKNKDYDIDLRNSKLIFRSSFAGTETVTLDYDYNSNGVSWMFPSNPEKDRSSKLKRTDYPRVVVSEITFGGDFMGFSSDKQNNTVVFQIDVATKKGMECTDYIRVKTDGTTETVSESNFGSNTVDVLSHGIINAIKRNWRTEFINRFYPSENMFRGLSPITIDNDVGIYRKAIDIELRGFNLGEED